MYSTKMKSQIGSIVLKDEKLNLPEKSFSYYVQKLAVKSASKSSFDSAAADMNRFKGLNIAKKSIEEMSVDVATNFDNFYDQRSSDGLKKIARSKDFSVITTDAKGIVVRPEDLRAQAKKAAEKESTQKRSKRLGEGEKRNRKRMAQLSAIYHVVCHTRTPDDLPEKYTKRKTLIYWHQRLPGGEGERLGKSVFAGT